MEPGTPLLLRGHSLGGLVATCAAAAPPTLVQAHGFDALSHEVFNASDAAPVWAVLHAWSAPRY